MDFQAVVINVTVLSPSIDSFRGVLDVAPCRTLRGGEQSSERLTSSQGVAPSLGEVVWEELPMPVRDPSQGSRVGQSGCPDREGLDSRRRPDSRHEASEVAAMVRRNPNRVALACGSGPAPTTDNGWGELDGPSDRRMDESGGAL
jgi:hypothetical protein